MVNFLAFSVLDEREEIRLDKDLGTAQFHRFFLGFLRSTVTVPLSDIDGIEEEVDKTASGLKR